MKTDYKKLATSILTINIIGILIGLIVNTGTSDWYNTLNKPYYTPPSWVFAPVWITLYTLIGVSFYLVWVDKKFDTESDAYSIFLMQLALNYLWTLVFFGLQSVLLGLIVIIILDFFIIANIYLFSKINIKAALLLLPYLIWVIIATLLNSSIYVLNQ